MDVRACVPAISSTRQIPLVLALLMVAMVSSSEAFLGTKAIGGWQEKHNQQQQQQQQRIRSITALQISKSGGKAVVTEEQFRDLVLAEDVAIPVLVFFSAPW
jgi:type II secretory pathway component PulK